MKRFIGFDGLTFPLTEGLISIEQNEGPIQGIAVTWATIEGEEAATIEFKFRGREPIHVSLREEKDGSYEIVLPPLKITPTLEEWTWPQ